MIKSNTHLLVFRTKLRTDSIKFFYRICFNCQLTCCDSSDSTTSNERLQV